MVIKKEECPCCIGKGFVKFERIVFRNKVFKREDYIDDCPLCLSWGKINILNNEYRTADHRERHFYAGRSTLIEELKRNRIPLHEERI